MRPLSVVILGPPLENSGGIGTLFSYFRNQNHVGVDLRFIDTRGKWKRAPLSFINVSGAIFVCTYLAITKKIDLAHLNFSAKGSTFRKLILLHWLKKTLQIPTVMHLHASSFEIWMQTLSRHTRRLVVKGINLADKIFVLGSSTAESLIAYGIDSARIQTLVMGVPDLQRVWPEKDHSSNSTRILFAGEMSERKGLPALLDAMSHPQLDNFELFVAGSGSVESWRNRISDTPAQSRVKFLGHVPVTTIHHYLANSDILILPSRAEGLPVSVMEGFSAGSLVMATAVGELGDYLIDNENGIVIDSAEGHSIVSAFSRVQDRCFRLELAKRGRATWRESFDASKTSQTLIQEWRKILQAATSR